MREISKEKAEIMAEELGALSGADLAEGTHELATRHRAAEHPEDREDAAGRALRRELAFVGSNSTV